MGMPLSFSQISTWLECRYKYYLAYILEGGLVPVEKPRPLSLGGLTHKALRDVISHEDWKENLNASIKAQTQQLEMFQIEHDMDEMEEQIIRVIEKWEDDNDLENWRTVLWKKPSKAPKGVAQKQNVPLLEQKIVLEILLELGWTGFTFILDWMAEFLPNNTTWINDFKVRKSFPTEGGIEFDLQMTIYQFLAVTELGIDVSGTNVWNVLQQTAQKPKMNKDYESVSRRSTNCDWKTYKARILEYGLDPQDYQDMKAKLEGKVFSRQDRTFRSRVEIENAWTHVALPVAKEIPEVLDRKPLILPRVLKPHICNRCEYRDFCIERLRGRDVSDMIGTSLITRQEQRERKEKANG